MKSGQPPRWHLMHSTTHSIRFSVQRIRLVHLSSQTLSELCTFFVAKTTSAISMASVTNFFPYQRLKHEGGSDDEYERERVVLRSRSLNRFRRVHIRRRFRLKVPSLRRFLKKVRVVTTLRVSCAKVLKRLKESQAHFGDLFAGNYLFMQVNPSSLKYLEKSCKGHELNALPSRYTLPRIAQ